MGDTVLELGAGIGNYHGAADGTPPALRGGGERSAVSARAAQPVSADAQRRCTQSESGIRPISRGLGEPFDTRVCLNVLEYMDDPAAVVRGLRATLKPDGCWCSGAAGARLFGSLDRRLGHKRRYDAADARALLESNGLTVRKVYDFNKAGAPPWWAYSKMLDSKSINKPVLKVFDKTVWLWRRIDWLLPWRGLSLILVAGNVGVGRGCMTPPPGARAGIQSRAAGLLSNRAAQAAVYERVTCPAIQRRGDRGKSGNGSIVSRYAASSFNEMVSLGPTLGHEQRGRRPVRIVSPEAFNRVTKLPVVLPITSGGSFARTAGLAVPLAGAGNDNDWGRAV